MKNFVKDMDKTGRGFEYLRNKFPNVGEAKIKGSMRRRRKNQRMTQVKMFIHF